MPEFGTIPPKWNKNSVAALLAHGLAKPHTYMVRKYGDYFEGLNGETSKIDFGGEDDAGGASGTNLTAIMHKMKDAMALTGGVIKVKGRLLYSDTIIINNPNIKIEGEHKESSILEYSGPDVGLAFDSGVPSFRFESCGLKDLTVKTTGTGAIPVRLTNNWYFHGSNFLLRGSGVAAAGLCVEQHASGVSNFNYFDQFEILDCKVGLKIRQRDPTTGPCGNNDMVFSSGWIWITDSYLEVQRAEGTVGVDESENHQAGLTANNVFVNVKVQQFEKGFHLKSRNSKMYGCSTENCATHIILDGNFQEVYGHTYFWSAPDIKIIINGAQCIVVTPDAVCKFDTAEFELNTPLTWKLNTGASKGGLGSDIAIGHDDVDNMLINVPDGKQVAIRVNGLTKLQMAADGKITFASGAKLDADGNFELPNADTSFYWGGGPVLERSLLNLIISLSTGKYIAIREAGVGTFNTLGKDFQVETAGKGVKLTNAAGTITKRVRLNDAGDGLIFE